MTILLNCKICSKEFGVRPSKSNAKYCSKKCSNKSKIKEKIIKSCLNCDIKFQSRSYENKIGKSLFCSRTCSISYGNNKRFKTEPERFLLKISDENNVNFCWLWSASKDENGYGVFTTSYGKTHRATRYIWELFNNEKLSSSLIMCHKCDNPSCVNPNHLWPGTHKENIRDMMAKNRRQDWRGEKSPCAKLTNKSVSIIKKRLFSGETQASISKDFNVTPGTISKINNNEAWGHVT